MQAFRGPLCDLVEAFRSLVKALTTAVAILISCTLVTKPFRFGKDVDEAIKQLACCSVLVFEAIISFA